MSDVTSIEKKPCGACGAELVWTPKHQCLACPNCGTVAEVSPQHEGEVQEYDLLAALESIPDGERGWQAEKITVKCQTCTALSVFDASTVGQRCDFCGSTQLVPYEQTTAPFRPESVLPLRLTESDARDALRKWYSSVWFAPNNLAKGSRADTVKGVYLPFWTFDAHVSADWSADAGYHYYTEETYRDSDGKTQTRRVQHTRWEPRSGHCERTFDDLLISASKGVASELLDDAGPFPTDELVHYQPSFVSGWTVEQYQIDLAAAATRSREKMEAEMESQCAAAVPGDTHRALRVHCAFDDETFKHILAPVWLLTYRYGTKTYQVVVNGVSGKVAGRYPKSWMKIALLCVGVILVIGVVVQMFR